MENKAISRTLKLLAQLMELHEENPFKIKSIANASFKIDKLPTQLNLHPISNIDQIDGVGKGISAKIVELLNTGTLQELEDILQRTPPGIIEMLGIKGIGPKKIGIIWHSLNIETVGELYYACNENRLIEAKGFGLKTQEDIKKLIEFKMAANGKFLYAHVEGVIHQLYKELAVWLNKIDQHALLGIAGDFRRNLEIIEDGVFLIGTNHLEGFVEIIQVFEGLAFSAIDQYNFIASTAIGLEIKLSVVKKDDFYINYFKLTGNDSHVNQVLNLAGKGSFKTEEDIYSTAGLDFILPELREGLDEIILAKSHLLPQLITNSDLKGSLHNHTDWSDGVNTLEEMAIYCKENLNLEYLGVCDHSKSAFYAKGLSEERVFAQHLKIDELNLKLAPFKIFKGIESDILNDGSLDYSDDILKTFDFVVASVHSNLRMEVDKATVRLIKAVENPYTTILGHPTGRLLLSRKGYDIDFKKVIDACAANHVVIEINANPLRLDLDWRWHRYALEKGVLLTVNPDAHREEGLNDMRFGVMVGRKGGLTAAKCLNAFSLIDIESYFRKRNQNF